MSRPETDQRDLFDIDEAELEAMLQKLLQDFATRDFSGMDPDAATILSTMPAKLREYVAALKQIKNQKEEIKTEKDPRKKEEKKKVVEAKLQKLASETFTAACASTLPIADVLKFHAKCNLGVRGLNEFADSGLNPLAAAMASGRRRGDIEQLINAGADVNFKSPQNSNAAHFAVMFNANPEVMKLLIERGVDVNLVNNFGFTPRDMAVMKGRGELAQILKEAGAKLNRVAPPKAAAEEEEAGKKDKKGVGRDKKQEDEEREKEKALERKKGKEEQKKELEEQKRELETARAAMVQKQIAQSQLALQLAEESKEAGKKFAEQQKAKVGLNFSFSAAKEDEIRPVSPVKTVTVEVPKETREAAQAAAAKAAEASPKFELKVEKEPNFLEKIAEKIFGKDSLTKAAGMNMDDLLLFAVQCGAPLEALFLIGCGANPNRAEVMDAALTRGNNMIIAVASRVRPEILGAAANSLGASASKSVLELVNEVLRPTEKYVERSAAVVAPLPSSNAPSSASHAPHPAMPTRISPELHYVVAAKKAVPEIPAASASKEQMLPERPSPMPRGPFEVTKARQQFAARAA
jgi:hypothetical protein